LAKKIVLEDKINDINLIGGVDLSYKDDIGYIVYVILDKNLELINEYIFKEKVEFPYIPSFLAFREGEPIIKTFNKIKEKIRYIICKWAWNFSSIQIGFSIICWGKIKYTYYWNNQKIVIWKCY